MMEAISPTSQRLALENKIAENSRRLEDSRTRKGQVVEQIGQFVGYFYGMMLQQMRQTVPENPLFHGGRGEEIFSQQLDFHLGEEMATTRYQVTTQDGYLKEHMNPLTREMSRSLLKTLDRQIEGLEKRLEKLRLNLEEVDDVSLRETQQFMEKLDDLTSLTRQSQEDAELQAAGRISSLIKK